VGGLFSQSLPIQEVNAASQLRSRSVWEQGLNFLPFWCLVDVQLSEALIFIRVRSPNSICRYIGLQEIVTTEHMRRLDRIVSVLTAAITSTIETFG
jgi:hypothetical protein